MDAAQAEIHAYEAPWKALCDFALHSDLDKMSMAGNPHYGQLVSQVRGREGGRVLTDLIPNIYLNLGLGLTMTTTI